MLVRDNKYIPEEDKDFFILLRIGLWQVVREELSKNPNWEYILQLSKEQTVQGIVADGIGIYQRQYPELNITQEQNDKFLSASAQIVRQNFKVNQVLAKLSRLLEEQNITYVLLKGQGVAQNYPKPNLRCSGDIDFFFDDDNYEIAKVLLAPLANGCDEEKSYERHIGFFIDDIEVELHANDAHFIERGPMFKQLLDDMLHEGAFEHYDCNETDITLAPSTFHLMYIFLHFCTHYYTSGLGLRQICDWTMLLNKEQDTTDKKQLHQYIKQLDLEKQWNLFLRFAQDYLELDSTVCNLFKIKSSPGIYSELCRRKGDKRGSIWTSCKENGNFGHNRPHEERAATRIGRFLQGQSGAYALAKRESGVSKTIAIKQMWKFYKNYVRGVIMKRINNLKKA